MRDYLVDVGKTGRILAIALLSLATAILAAGDLLIVVTAADRKAWAEIPGPLIGSGLIFGVLTISSAWMLLRLLRGRRSSSTITMMPVRFIQGLGILYSAAILFVALKGPGWIFAGEGVGFALSATFLPWLLRRRRGGGG
ncbi:MAG TPA: hypothetical protein VG406_23300, partial [Isosphaeraceae bacterium]|nr:hypothetical protein [Isosphaeraceae bacterium]